MLYSCIFLIRYFPFWAIPFALAIFELGVYFYNRRDRKWFVSLFGISGILVVTTIIWIVFEGYWRAGPFVKKMFDEFYGAH